MIMIKLDGSMSMGARDAAITKFTKDHGCRIFLMSLRAGGVALNLTVASSPAASLQDSLQAVVSGMVFVWFLATSICPRLIKILKGMKMHSERRNFGRATSVLTVTFFIFCASGIARGSGWQHIGAYVNLGAFYLVGIPSAVVLGFVFKLKAKGLWIGIVIGSVLQSTDDRVIVKDHELCYSDD